MALGRIRAAIEAAQNCAKGSGIGVVEANLAVPIVAHGMQNTCDFLFIYQGGVIPGT